MGEVKRGLIIFILFSILTGLIYPFFIAGIGQILWKEKANGSLVKKENVVIGSKLLGQNFSNPRYFHGRPSYVDYKGSISGASNLGPTSKKLFENASRQINLIRNENNLSADYKIPADLILASASGLDPHISLDSALLQANRIANTRGINIDEVKRLIHKNLEEPQFKLLGQKRINVLNLNLALDEISK